MNDSKRSSAMPQSSATGAAIRTNEVGAARPVARAAFRFSSHRFRPKGGCRCHCDCDDDGCRPHCACHDESAGDCASLPALLGSLSTPKANRGRPLAERTPRAYRQRKRRSQQERNAFGHSLRADRPLALSRTGRLAQFAPAWEEELWCSRPVSALAIEPALTPRSSDTTRPPRYRTPYDDTYQPARGALPRERFSSLRQLCR